MARRRKKNNLPTDPVELTIDGISHDGRGVGHIEGKTVFVDGALPGEQVQFLYTSKRSKLDEGRAVEIISSSPQRVDPRCAQALLCGGCSLQHMSTVECGNLLLGEHAFRRHNACIPVLSE